MSQNEVAIRFNNVTFEYSRTKPILDEAHFSLRSGAKVTLMGQNGAGKSTIFQLITGAFKPESGSIHISSGLTIATALQVMPRAYLDLTVLEFFEQCFSEKKYNIAPKIDEVLQVVNLKTPQGKTIRSFSGGQQARLLMASALIQDPDILLLDEPTNNLDQAGIEHLTQFLIEYPKTCIVISHDAAFLNAFTEGVLYLDIFTHKIEQYVGNYFDVVAEISARIEKEIRKNAQYEKEIIANKEKANFFANKGGGMRLVAKKMRTKAREMEEAKVNIRKEDKAIRPFTIPIQPEIGGEVLHIDSFSVVKNHALVLRKENISLRKNQHLLLSGPNGIGKSTLLESLAANESNGATISPGIVIGYYRQDFSNLDLEQTVYDSLSSALQIKDEQKLRSTAAGFLITKEVIGAKIGSLSEGQKGLVSFARLVLMEPGLLILDEPTNHINFRHLPIIAKALDQYTGAMILVSHVPEFVQQIRIDSILDLTT